MEIIYLDGQMHNFNEPIVSAIGFFDGLHLGHMALVDEVKRVSKLKGYKSALMTFDHHPLFVLGRMEKEYILTSMEDRKALLEKEGLDYLFIICFNKETASLSPEHFIEKYLIDLNIHHIVCGFDFHFGNKNSGNTDSLKNYNSSLLDVSVVDEVLYENEKVSSTRTRLAIEEGDMKLVSVLLGRYYRIRGHVIDGRKVGREIGFPTANIDYSSYLLPASGVYAVYVYVDGVKYLGMCNVGHNPTVGTLKKRSVEVHIFDFDAKIYGKNIGIEFIERTRGEIHFSSKDELMKQLKKDQLYIQQNY